MTLRVRLKELARWWKPPQSKVEKLEQQMGQPAEVFNLSMDADLWCQNVAGLAEFVKAQQAREQATWDSLYGPGYVTVGIQPEGGEVGRPRTKPAPTPKPMTQARINDRHRTLLEHLEITRAVLVDVEWQETELVYVFSDGSRLAMDKPKRVDQLVKAMAGEGAK